MHNPNYCEMIHFWFNHQDYITLGLDIQLSSSDENAETAKGFFGKTESSPLCSSRNFWRMKYDCFWNLEKNYILKLILKSKHYICLLQDLQTKKLWITLKARTVDQFVLSNIGNTYTVLLFLIKWINYLRNMTQVRNKFPKCVGALLIQDRVIKIGRISCPTSQVVSVITRSARSTTVLWPASLTTWSSGSSNLFTWRILASGQKCSYTTSNKALRSKVDVQLTEMFHYAKTSIVIRGYSKTCHHVYYLNAAGKHQIVTRPVQEVLLL